MSSCATTSEPTRPRLYAAAIACARLWTPSLASTCWMCVPTVFGLMTRVAAISRWLWPSASSSRISRSRGLGVASTCLWPLPLPFPFAVAASEPERLSERRTRATISSIDPASRDSRRRRRMPAARSSGVPRSAEVRVTGKSSPRSPAAARGSLGRSARAARPRSRRGRPLAIEVEQGVFRAGNGAWRMAHPAEDVLGELSKPAIVIDHEMTHSHPPPVPSQPRIARPTGCTGHGSSCKRQPRVVALRRLRRSPSGIPAWLDRSFRVDSGGLRVFVVGGDPSYVQEVSSDRTIEWEVGMTQRILGPRRSTRRPLDGRSHSTCSDGLVLVFFAVSASARQGSGAVALACLCSPEATWRSYQRQPEEGRRISVCRLERRHQPAS